MNKIILLGNVTRNPKTTRKKNEDGTDIVITKFDLAVNRKTKQKSNADADFFHCTSFGKQAEFVEKYFHSGSRVLVIGRVQNNNYTTKEDALLHGFGISCIQELVDKNGGRFDLNVSEGWFRAEIFF